MATESHIVTFSGGAGSWCAAWRVAQRVPRLTLLFADTLMEDEDLYRFIDDAVANLSKYTEVNFVRVADGRTPWEVFRDERYLGNARADPCSKILKRRLLDCWIEEHGDSRTTTVYLGIDWTESHRLDKVRALRKPWRYEAPMCAKPYWSKQQVLDHMVREGITPPRLYAMGFPHNNCGGFCIKAGHAQFALLLKKFPDRYLEHEQAEQGMRAQLDRDDISILRDLRGGTTSPMSLREFRLRLEKQPDQFDPHDLGGCGCAID